MMKPKIKKPTIAFEKKILNCKKEGEKIKEVKYRLEGWGLTFIVNTDGINYSLYYKGKPTSLDLLKDILTGYIYSQLIHAINMVNLIPNSTPYSSTSLSKVIR